MSQYCLQIRETQKEPFPLQLSLDATVGDLRTAIASRLNSAQANFRMLHRGLLLSEDSDTLKKLAFRRQDTVYIGMIRQAANDDPDADSLIAGMIGNPLHYMVGGAAESSGKLFEGLAAFGGLGGLGYSDFFTARLPFQEIDRQQEDRNALEIKAAQNLSDLLRQRAQEQTDQNYQRFREKLDHLRDMGFTDDDVNLEVLTRTNGDLAEALEILERN